MLENLYFLPAIQKIISKKKHIDLTTGYMDFSQELRTTEFDDLFDRLTAYVSCKLKDVDIKEMDGKEPSDIVSDLFEKVLTGKRNPENISCSFEEFLFGCLKSDIDAFFRKKKISWLSIAEEDGETHGPDTLASELATAKTRIITELIKVGADEKEIEMFNIWSEGITKPAKVGTEIGLVSSEVYKIQRRLHSHLREIHKQHKIVV